MDLNEIMRTIDEMLPTFIKLVWPIRLHRAHRKIYQGYSLGLLTFSGCVVKGLVDP